MKKGNKTKNGFGFKKNIKKTIIQQQQSTTLTTASSYQYVTQSFMEFL